MTAQIKPTDNTNIDDDDNNNNEDGEDDDDDSYHNSINEIVFAISAIITRKINDVNEIDRISNFN
eukprot:scaffold174735_cov17-Prasinocladus_malaysianus.AAC.1